MKRVLVMLLAVTILLFTACGQPNPAVIDSEADEQTYVASVKNDVDEETNEVDEQPVIPKYIVQIELECEENLFFSRYDVDIFIDQNKEGTLDHGATDTYQFELEEGIHILTVTKKNESDVDGSVKFTVSEDMELRYKLSCTSGQVKIEIVEEEDNTSENTNMEEAASQGETANTGSIADDDRTKWIRNQFSLWDGSHKGLEKLIIRNLNDEDSYKHIETTYIDISDEAMQDFVNETLETSGYPERVEIGDLFIMTEFSAKNAFNATIKCTAFGIASYNSNSIILIGIE